LTGVDRHVDRRLTSACGGASDHILSFYYLGDDLRIHTSVLIYHKVILEKVGK
jgi:hypothetical protein